MGITGNGRQPRSRHPQGSPASHCSCPPPPPVLSSTPPSPVPDPTQAQDVQAAEGVLPGSRLKCETPGQRRPALRACSLNFLFAELFSSSPRESRTMIFILKDF